MKVLKIYDSFINIHSEPEKISEQSFIFNSITIDVLILYASSSQKSFSSSLLLNSRTREPHPLDSLLLTNIRCENAMSILFVSHEFFRERFSGSSPRYGHSTEPNGRLVPLSNSLNGLPSMGSRMREWEQQLSHAGQRPMRSRSLPVSPLSMYVDVHNRRAAKYPLHQVRTSPMPLTRHFWGTEE